MNSVSLILNIYYSVYSYVWVLIILLLFIIYVNIYSTMLINTNFKLLSTNFFIKYNFFFFLLSLAGVPPLLGFFNKIFLINILVNTNNTLLFLFVIIINTFLLVFYIQQVKFLNSSKKKFIYFKNNFKQNNFLVQFFIYCQFLNQFAIFILPNFFMCVFYNLLCIF